MRKITLDEAKKLSDQDLNPAKDNPSEVGVEITFKPDEAESVKTDLGLLLQRKPTTTVDLTQLSHRFEVITLAGMHDLNEDILRNFDLGLGPNERQEPHGWHHHRSDRGQQFETTINYCKDPLVGPPTLFGETKSVVKAISQRYQQVSPKPGRIRRQVSMNARALCDLEKQFKDYDILPDSIIEYLGTLLRGIFHFQLHHAQQSLSQTQLDLLMAPIKAKDCPTVQLQRIPGDVSICSNITTLHARGIYEGTCSGKLLTALS